MANPKSSKPTLRTISQMSGLAVPTVSRALNDAPDIGKATKERVRRIAREIGYVPNRAGVRLRTGKTNVVSLVLGTDNEVTDHTGQLVSSIARELRDTRYHMIVTPYFPDEDPMNPVRYIVETGSADAVILNRIEMDDPRIVYLKEKNFPFVTYGRTRWRESHPYFDFDNTFFGRVAGENLVARGHRHILLIAPPQHQNYAQDMINGARDAVAGTGATLAILDSATGDDPGPVIQEAVAEYLRAQPETGGLICPSTTAAIAAVVGAERQGRVIGTDLDVYAKEAIPFLKHFRAPIGTVREDVLEAGQFLARAAIHAIERPTAPPMQRLVEAAAN